MSILILLNSYCCHVAAAAAFACFLCFTYSSLEANIVLGVKLIGDSKLVVGLNVSLDGCLFLYVGPAMN